jgi:serine/threonine protein kinase
MRTPRGLGRGWRGAALEEQRPGDLPDRVHALEWGDPTAVGPYGIVGRLGAGGMGAVYLGRSDDGMLVAVKIIRDALAEDRGFRERFETEVQNAKRVASFCTAAVIASGLHEDRPYLVTEYIDGPTLYDQVTENGPLPPGTLHGVAVGTAAALTAIHVAGLVHRDLKPSNVILSMSGPRVIDFGIARAMDATSAHTATGDLIGSPGWMAPEHLLRHHVTPASDVFAWGCLVAFSGRGRHPYGAGEAIAMVARIIHGEPELEGLPDKLAPLVGAALSKDPGRRPSAQELLLDLVGGAPHRVNANVSQVLEETWQNPEETLLDDPAPADGRTDEPATGGTRTDDPATHPGQRAWQHQGTLPVEPPGELATQPRVPEQRQRRGRRPYVLGGSAAALAAVVVSLVLGGLFSPDAGQKGSSSPARVDDVLARQGFAPVALRAKTDVGRPVADSSLEYTVGRPRCGGRSYGGQSAKGRLCLVPVSIRNVAEPSSGPAPPISLQRARQRLVDSTGATRTPVEVKDGFLAGDSSIAPGGMVAGELVFDLPAGATPAQVKLSRTDSGTDKGVSLWV